MQSANIASPYSRNKKRPSSIIKGSSQLVTHYFHELTYKSVSIINLMRTPCGTPACQIAGWPAHDPRSGFFPGSLLRSIPESFNGRFGTASTRRCISILYYNRFSSGCNKEDDLGFSGAFHTSLPARRESFLFLVLTLKKYRCIIVPCNKLREFFLLY